jgi:cytochrome c-type biogenesis protein CcmH
MSSQLWIILALMLLVASVFFLLPWVKSRKSTMVINNNQLLEENVRLFNEQLVDLESQQKVGRINDTEYQTLKLELERNLLQTYNTLQQEQVGNTFSKVNLGYFGLIILFGISVFFLYQHLGASDDLRIMQLQKVKQEADYQDMLNNKLPDLSRSTELINELEKHLTNNQDNLQYWFLLARLASERKDFAKSITAYQEILKRDQTSGMVMAELAQVMFLKSNNQMTAEAGQLASKALELEPRNTTALGLLGIDAFSKKNYVEAIKFWQKAVDLLGANSDAAVGLSMGIEKAKMLYVAEVGSQENLDKTLTGISIHLEVSVAANVTANPDQFVYVYARGWKGAKMPLAITRIKFSELPAKVTLTEAMAMSPAATLATATQIELVARISSDGSAVAKSGDWQASQGPVDLKQLPEKISLTIDKKIE